VFETQGKEKGNEKPVGNNKGLGQKGIQQRCGSTIKKRKVEYHKLNAKHRT